MPDPKIPDPGPDPTINDSTPTPAATPTPPLDAGGDKPDADASKDTVSQAEYDKLQTQVDSYKAMETALSGAGIKTADELTARFKQPSPADFTKLIQDALKPSADPPATPQVPAAMTADQIDKLVNDKLAVLAQDQAQRAYETAATTEADLKSRVLSDPAFKAIMQGATFEQACKGEKGLAAKLLAMHADNLFYERGLTGQDGAYQPVTSAAIVDDVVQTLRKTVLEMRAATLLEGSTEPTSPEAPDAPSQSPHEPIQVDLATEELLSQDAVDSRKKQDAAVRQTFEQSYKQSMAGQLGVPLSQSVA